MNQKLLFAELDIPVLDRARTLLWLDGIPDEFWVQDPYRKCLMLPVLTRNGGSRESDLLQFHVETPLEEFSWVHFTPDFIRKYFEENIFNWTKTKGRIVICKTAPGGENPVHIDCFPETFNTLQHKLRIVIQGASDTLYFETRDGKIPAPQTTKPFIMDGSWPHGMINNSSSFKYTLCFGSPWTHSDYYPGLNTLLSSEGKKMPECYEKYFHPRFKKKERLLSV